MTALPEEHVEALANRLYDLAMAEQSITIDDPALKALVEQFTWQTGNDACRSLWLKIARTAMEHEAKRYAS